MKKIANSCIWGPILRAFLDILGGLPIGPELSNFKIFELFPLQNQNSKGVYSAGRLGQMGVSANRPKLDQFWRMRTFFCTESKFKGGIFYEKKCHLI